MTRALLHGCSAARVAAPRQRLSRTRLCATRAEQRPPPAAAFGTTPSAVKQLVSGLTRLVNAASGLAEPSDAVVDTRPPVTPADVLAGVRGDFTDRCYLWTGEISSELYAVDATFTDPTLSFQGLATFERNLAALQPVLRALLRTREVDLLNLTEGDEGAESGEAGFVEAAWRMGADLSLPWQPRIELTGRTRFFYSPARGGRIVRYVEAWDVPATEALMQIVRPFAWKGVAAATTDKGRGE
jgi:hypothetical protein